MSENGNEKGDEKDKDRDEKGRFIPGKPGGPGRGKTKSGQELSDAIEEIKELLQDDGASLTDSRALKPVGSILLHGIMSKDSKNRNDSAKLFCSWHTKMRETEDREKQEDSGASPEDLTNFARAVAIKQDLDAMDAEGITDLLCVGCKKRLGIDDEGLKENDPC